MIKMNHLNKTYYSGIEVQALKEVNLVIEKGEFILIVGKSGSGKSTLLNVIGCMDGYDSGEYFFFDQDVRNLSGRELAQFRNRKVGFVFQSFQLVNELTVGENIEMPMGIAGVPRNERKKRIKELLEMVGLAEKENCRPLQLSGGQQQRVAIARALANHPEVLLCDEPTGNLDETNGIKIMELLKKLNKEGTTVIMVTHDLTLKLYADRIIEIKNGICG
ncbi:MAG: ABC transporter ATP-binding protein [Clostridium sp.]|nr:ABC transporter ATP-binding protein [Clostridium sp.]